MRVTPIPAVGAALLERPLDTIERIFAGVARIGACTGVVLFGIEGPLTAGTLERALHVLPSRHLRLGTRVRWNDGNPVFTADAAPVPRRRRGDPSVGSANKMREDETPLALEIHNALLALWRQTNGATIYLPLALGGHVDHRLCASLGEGLRAAGARVAHYEDFPYAVNLAGEIAERARQLNAEESWVEDVTEQLEVRLDAIACYASQLDMLTRSCGPLAPCLRAYATGLGVASGRYYERYWRGSPSPFVQTPSASA